jgi:Leucine-rich repeat (LRR) protein
MHRVSHIPRMCIILIFLLIFLYVSSGLQTLKNIPPYQYNALYDLYLDLDGSSWYWLDGTITGDTIPWNFTQPYPSVANPCADKWQGISCSSCVNISSSYCYVTVLNLDAHRLSGRVPYSVGTLSSLTNLILANNNITGSLPSSISNLTELTEFDVHVNHLTGSIPIELSFLTNLKQLQLGGNLFNGTIPDFIFSSFSNLELLTLQDNFLSGSLSFSIGNLQNLIGIALSVNQLTSTLPSSIGSMKSLVSLDLKYNYFNGSIPKTIGLLSNLTTLGLTGNRLTSSIPVELCNLTKLEIVNLDTNLLTGRIPAEFGNLTSLTDFIANQNSFFGSLPETIINVNSHHNLVIFSVGANLLSGTLPTVFSAWTELQVLAIHRNSFTGYFNSSLFNAYEEMRLIQFNINHFYGQFQSSFLANSWKYLGEINFGMNAFSGSLPVSLWPRLSYYLAFVNYFTGTIPNDFSTATKLYYYELSTNYLSGNIPPYFASLTILTYFNLSINHFTGNLNYTFGALNVTGPNTLAQLSVAYNHLTGTIPSTLGRAIFLVDLIVNNNELTGPIPQSLRTLAKLQVLFLQNNMLTGPLYNSIRIVSLTNIDVSNNQFTGFIPSFVQITPSLSSFAASSNCLSGTIPVDICELTTFTVVTLNGLSSSTKCRISYFPDSPLLTAFTVRNYLLNGIPSCLFRMPNLQTLHLSGNGLTGSLPSNVNISSSLSDLSLSHNQLTGTIPLSIQERSWINLDLSYNKLTGTLSSSFSSYDSESSLSLDINRLSGDIPSSLLSASNINILGGNMFECNNDHSDLPSHDQDTIDYSCGSDVVNATIYLWIAALACIVLLVCFIIRRTSQLIPPPSAAIFDDEERGSMSPTGGEQQQSRDVSLPSASPSLSSPSLSASGSTSVSSPSLTSMNNSESHRTSVLDVFVNNVNHWRNKIVDYHDDDANTTLMLRSIRTFLYKLRLLACRFTFIILVVLLPIYTIVNPYFNSHSHSYAWSVSAVLLTGRKGAIVLFFPLIFFLFFCILLYRIMIESESNFVEINYRLSKRFVTFLNRVSTVQQSDRYFTKITLLTVGIINFFLMMIADIAYVIIIISYPTEVIVVTEIFLALFKLALNNYFLWKLIPWSRNTLHRYFLKDPNLAGPPIASDNPLSMGGISLTNMNNQAYNNNGIVKSGPVSISSFSSASSGSSSPSSASSNSSSFSSNASSSTEASSVSSSASRVLSLRMESHKAASYSYSPKEVTFIMLTILMNNIVFPVLAICIVAPECFYYALFAAPEINSSYTYTICDKYSNVLRYCYTNVVLQEQSSYDPPFIYGYECASTLIINYTSVFIIMYTYEGFVSPLIKIIFKIASNRIFYEFVSTKENKNKSRSTLREILKETSWTYRLLAAVLPDNLKDFTPTPPTNKPVILFDKNRLAVKINSSLVVMVSFGALFPPLAVIICVTIITITIYEEIVIGRLLYESERLGYGWYKKQLERDCYGMSESLKYTLWSLIPVSSFLFAYIIFDTWGDELGWKSALPSTLVMGFVPIMVLFLLKNNTYLRTKLALCLRGTLSCFRRKDVEEEESPSSFTAGLSTRKLPVIVEMVNNPILAIEKPPIISEPVTDHNDEEE